MERLKWEQLNKDILVRVFQRVGMESLLLDIPFVCKSWYKASREPQCWQHLIFPEFNSNDIIEEEDPPCKRFVERLAIMTPHQENFPVTKFIKFIVDRSCGCATTIKLPPYCPEEALEYIANECPRLKTLSADGGDISCGIIIPKLISKWKNLETMACFIKFSLKETVAQIGLHCNNFTSLSAPYSVIMKGEASAVVASLPKLKYLDLRNSFIGKEALGLISMGCKQLVHLDVRECWGFDAGDAEVSALASHIPAFMCQGSAVIDIPDVDISQIRMDDFEFDIEDILDDVI